MGDVLEDLTKASLDKIEKYAKPEVAGPAAAVAEGELAPEPPEQARALKEARNEETGWSCTATCSIKACVILDTVGEQISLSTASSSLPQAESLAYSLSTMVSVFILNFRCMEV